MDRPPPPKCCKDRHTEVTPQSFPVTLQFVATASLADSVQSHVEASRVNPNPPPGPAAKATRVNGQMVNLHALALTYRICALAVIASLLLLAIVGVLLSRRMELTALGILIGGQLATGIAISIAFRQRRLGDAAVAIEPAPLPSRVFSTAADVLTAALCSLPLLGLLPAADLCGRAHRIFNTLDVPVGMLGPSTADIDALSPTVCPQCGGDFDQQHGTVCPICLSDVSDQHRDILISSNAAPAHPGQRRLDRSAAYQSRTHCAVLASISFIIAAAQLIALATLKNRDLLLLIWSPSIPMAIIGGIVASRGKRALGAHHSADELAIPLAMLLWPPFGGMLLIGMAVRLSRVVTTGRAS